MAVEKITVLGQPFGLKKANYSFSIHSNIPAFKSWVYS